MDSTYVKELLKFIVDLYYNDLPSMNVMFLKGQLYALYEMGIINAETWHEYGAYCTGIEQHRQLRALELEMERARAEELG